MQVNINDRSFIVDDEPNNKDFWGWVNNGKWETHTYRLFDRFLKPDMTYLDLGAWIGPTILYAASMVKRAVAVEPDPVAFDILKQNIACNGLNVKLIQEAVTNHDGNVELGSGLLGQSTTRANPSEGGGIGAWVPGQQCTVPCSTLQTFCTRFNILDPLFIKMDIEGSEEDILKDLSFFERRPTLYLSLHPFWWKDKQNTWEAVRKLGRMYGAIYSAQTLDNLDINGPLAGDLVFTE